MVSGRCITSDTFRNSAVPRVCSSLLVCTTTIMSAPGAWRLQSLRPGGRGAELGSVGCITHMDHYAPQTRKKVDADIDAELAKISADRRELLRRIFESMHIPDLNDTARLQGTIAKF